MSVESIVISESGRIDKVLSEVLGHSRNQIEKLIKNGLVSVNGKRVTKPGFKLTGGESVEYEFVKADILQSHDVEFEIDVLYEDEELLVVNKPSGIVVHPAPSVKGPTLVDWLIDRGVRLSTISGQERHGIVHRIDKETTGALVVAKTNETHRALSRQLQDKSMGRYYLALIDYPLKSSIRVDKPIFRDPNNRLKMAIVEGGREAITDFVTISNGKNDTSLIAAKLYTGRTHQIRVHLGSIGRHILGDSAYGYKAKKGKIPRVFLHAYMLYLVHPVSKKRLEVVAPMFDDMSSYIDKFFNKGEIDEKISKEYIRNIFDTITTAS